MNQRQKVRVNKYFFLQRTRQNRSLLKPNQAIRSFVLYILWETQSRASCHYSLDQVNQKSLWWILFFNFEPSQLRQPCFCCAETVNICEDINTRSDITPDDMSSNSTLADDVAHYLRKSKAPISLVENNYWLYFHIAANWRAIFLKWNYKRDH